MSSTARWVRGHRVLVMVPLLAVLSIGTVLLVVVRGGGARSATPGGDPVVATVGRLEIHRSLLDARVTVALTAATQGGAPGAGSPQYAAFVRQLRAGALKGLIIDTVIAQEAAARGVAASDAEVEREVRADVGIAGGQPQLETQLAEAGGSLATLRDETRSRLNEARLEEYFARQRAADAVSRLARGEAFAAVARELSDDTGSRSGGGDLGALAVDTLRGGDAAFLQAVMALRVGETTAAPVRDSAGFEILRLDAATATTRSLHRVLVQAPQPYTIRERPAWFGQSVLLAVAQDCDAGAIHVLIDTSLQPCGLATATPARSPSGPAASTTSPGPPVPAPSGPGGGFVPRPAPGATPTPAG